MKLKQSPIAKWFMSQRIMWQKKIDKICMVVAGLVPVNVKN